ncbi:yemanuclein [Drosophila persimilis]|uniref:yemanuclein n=1 Tax=Drosophila persimilis TaxID=7234 RepID=UPI000F079F8F|nr:yemanuclein [Drosophila persimilis]
MSRGGEHKRVSLTSIIQSESVFSRFGSNILEPEVPAVQNKPAKTTKSIRINLKLFETDTVNYPEFNYSKLLYLEKKKAKKLKLKTGNGFSSSDPFADNDDDVQRIAKELEAKYGTAYARGRGRSRREDHRDIGVGYDDTDSFIDNSEAYDEIIPEEVETLEGGFYINSGALEFKPLTKKSYTTRTDAIIKMPERSRKRIVSSSSESSSSSSSSSSSGEDNEDNNNGSDGDGSSDSESEESDDDDDDDDEEDSDSESLDDGDSANTAKSNSNDKYKSNHQAKRAKISSGGGGSGSVATKSKSKSKSSGSGSSTTSTTKPTKTLTVTSSSSNSPRPSAVDNSDSEVRQAQAQALKKVVKTTTVKDMLKAKRDSFLKSQSGTAAVKGTVVNGELKCHSTDDLETSCDTDSVPDQATMDKTPKGQGQGQGQAGENLRTADTQLPTSLDADILSTVNCFKETVKSRDMCGKKFTLDNNLSSLLLKVYEALLCTDRNERNMVFSHIEYQLQLPKYYILRKGKALRSKEEKTRTTIALESLRRAVSESMPKAIASYEVELHHFAEQAAADVNSEVPPKMPRKKFQWTSELRNLLFTVYQARWTSYAVLGKRKDSLEDFINGYMKEKVVELWPMGWMRYDELQREINRQKNSSRRSTEKPKTAAKPTAAAAAATPEPLPLPQANNYIRQVVDELPPGGAGPSRSRGNSDTDSATSASSNSLKRKLKEQPTGKTTKPPKTKLPKHQQHQPLQQPQPLQQQQPPPQIQVTPAAAVPVSAAAGNLENLLCMPSTSAQAAALAGMLGDLAASTRTSDQHQSMYNLITAATLAAAAGSNPSITTINSQQTGSICSSSTAAHSKVISGARPSPHVINLDDYRCPSDILQTSKQLAAHSSTTITITPKPTPTPVITSTNSRSSINSSTSPNSGGCISYATQLQNSSVNLESSSESDGVEIVGVYPAGAMAMATVTATAKPQTSKTKTKTQSKGKTATGTAGKANGASSVLGFKTDNMYIYNHKNHNNNNNNHHTAKVGVGVGMGPSGGMTVGQQQHVYDLSSNAQVMKTLSDLKNLEKHMTLQNSWQNQFSVSPSGGGGAMKGGAGAGNGGAGTSSHQ